VPHRTELRDRCRSAAKGPAWTLTACELECELEKVRFGEESAIEVRRAAAHEPYADYSTLLAAAARLEESQELRSELEGRSATQSAVYVIPVTVSTTVPL
jgi:hypothetical protein